MIWCPCCHLSIRDPSSKAIYTLYLQLESIPHTYKSVIFQFSSVLWTVALVRVLTCCPTLLYLRVFPFRSACGNETSSLHICPSLPPSVSLHSITPSPSQSIHQQPWCVVITVRASLRSSVCPRARRVVTTRMYLHQCMWCCSLASHWGAIKPPQSQHVDTYRMTPLLLAPQLDLLISLTSQEWREACVRRLITSQRTRTLTMTGQSTSYVSRQRGPELTVKDTEAELLSLSFGDKQQARGALVVLSALQWSLPALWYAPCVAIHT